MRIAFVNQYYKIGSTGKIVSDIMDYLDANSIECHAFCAQGIQDERVTLYGDKMHLRLTQLENRCLGNHSFGLFTNTSKIIDDLEKYNPDIVHLHNIHGFYLYAPSLFRYLVDYNKIVVWTLHDCWPMTGHCAYFDYVGCNKWRVGCRDCGGLKRYPQSWIDRSSTFYDRKKNLFTSCKKLNIVTPSKWLRDIVDQSFLAGSQSVTVINNGIDLEIFKPYDHNELKAQQGYQDKTVLLGVSSDGFSGRKGGAYFAEMAKQLDDRYRIIMIGVKDEDYKYLPDNIVKIRRTNNQEELAMYYSMSDVSINPTLEDNYPTVNLESLACGTPIITFMTGGSPESVTNGNGLVTAKNDTKSLIDCVNSIELSSNMRQRCANYAKSHFSKELFAKEYCNLFKTLLL